MEIHGFNKTTLLDYPGHLAATIFTGGCNFRCPFCHNGSLVLNPKGQPLITEEEIFAVLEKRKHMLEGVCITGGEPTLQKDLPDFIRRIKSLGILVKLDTNGMKPEMLKACLKEGLLDYVAMDIKNSKENYGLSTGLLQPELEKIEESVRLLKESSIEYEFRTTIVKEHHTAEDMERIGQWLAGAPRYYLQNYRDSEGVIEAGLHPWEDEVLKEFQEILKKYIPCVELRGISVG